MSAADGAPTPVSAASRRPPRPRLFIPNAKSVDGAGYGSLPSLAATDCVARSPTAADGAAAAAACGSLSPTQAPSSPPISLAGSSAGAPAAFRVGNYLLLDTVAGELNTYRAWHTTTMEECVCKVFTLSAYRSKLAPYFRTDGHPNVVRLRELVIGERHAYAVFDRHYGDLHSYLRSRTRLPEDEARRLFAQIVSAVAHCHASGVITCNLRLKKLVFANAERTRVLLSNLESCRLLDADAASSCDGSGVGCCDGSGSVCDDTVTDAPSCPPGYISPEALASSPIAQSLMRRAAQSPAAAAGGEALPESPARRQHAATPWSSLPPSDGRSSSGESNVGYSGRAADAWSLGVVLYTLLAGRYPFYEPNPARQFYMISSGNFAVPDSLSPAARCLIRCLLQQDAAQRPDAADVARHPWLRENGQTQRCGGGGGSAAGGGGGGGGSGAQQQQPRSMRLALAAAFISATAGRVPVPFPLAAAAAAVAAAAGHPADGGDQHVPTGKEDCNIRASDGRRFQRPSLA